MRPWERPGSGAPPAPGQLPRALARLRYASGMEPIAERPLEQDIRPGTFVGTCGDTSLGNAARRLGLGRVRRLLKEKRWQYFAAADDAVAVGGAIVDLGYAGNGFFWAVDRRTGALHEGEALVLPPFVHVGDAPGDARLGAVSLARIAGGLQAKGRLGPVGFSVQLLEEGGPALTAVAKVPGGGVNLTCKQAALRAFGTVELGGRTHELGASAMGLLDYTHGLLARETAWRWAAGSGRLADGSPVGFNLVEGFNDGLENGVWIGGRPQAVGAAAFSWDPGRPEARWRVQTADGRVDLRLDVEAVRAKDLDLGLAASRYRQPIGRWSGRIGGAAMEGVFGVAEDHLARW